MAFEKGWWQIATLITVEKRIMMVSVMIALSQGLNSLVDLPLSYLYKDDYHLNPAQVSSLSSLFTLPWIIKPVWGMISDNYPLLGYKRKTYVIMFGLLGFGAYIALAAWYSIMAAGIFLIFMVFFVLAFNNVIGEALLVESAQRYGALPGKTEAEKHNQASQNVSIFFFFKHFGMIISSYFGGLLLEHMTKPEIFRIASIALLVVGLVAITLPEERASKRPLAAAQPAIEEESARLINREGSERASVVPEESSFRKVWNFLRQPEIYKPLLFLFMFMITPGTGSAMFYFYTTELQFQPEFMGQLKLAGSCALVLGIVIYNKFLKDVGFKPILIWSSIICSLLSLSQLLLITRYNQNLGIPDKLFCIGDSIIIQVFGELNFLPILILACRLCPKNVEGTMYALFLSVFNCGGMVSNQLGAFFIWVLGITETDFSRLWILVIIASVSTILPLPFLSMIQFDAAIKKAEEKPQVGGERLSAQEAIQVEDEFKENSIKNV